MSPIERKAALKAAITLQRLTLLEAAAKIGISYNHMLLVLSGERDGSIEVEKGLAELIGRPVWEVFPNSRHTYTRPQKKQSGRKR